MTRPKKVSDEEILAKMWELVRKSPDGTVSLSELARELGIRKQSLSQRLYDGRSRRVDSIKKRRVKDLVDRGYVIKVGRRYKLTDRGISVAKAYLAVKERIEKRYIDSAVASILEIYAPTIEAIVESIERKEPIEKRLPLCYLSLDLLLFLILLRLGEIAVKAINENDFERELKNLWEKPDRITRITLKEAIRKTLVYASIGCEDHIADIFDKYILALIGIFSFIGAGFFNMATTNISYLNNLKSSQIPQMTNQDNS
jgi:Mn-dependent DtxR family transcriptional regulator